MMLGPIHRATVLLLAGLVSLASGCGPPPDYVIANRSNVPIAVAPGVVIDACASSSFSRQQLEAAGRDALDRALVADFAWVPADAVLLDGGVPGGQVGAPRPLTYVISSTSSPRTLYGSFDASQLPPCGGDPIL